MKYVLNVDNREYSRDEDAIRRKLPELVRKFLERGVWRIEVSAQNGEVGFLRIQSQKRDEKVRLTVRDATRKRTYRNKDDLQTESDLAARAEDFLNNEPGWMRKYAWIPAVREREVSRGFIFGHCILLTAAALHGIFATWWPLVLAGILLPIASWSFSVMMPAKALHRRQKYRNLKYSLVRSKLHDVFGTLASGLLLLAGYRLADFAWLWLGVSAFSIFIGLIGGAATLRIAAIPYRHPIFKDSFQPCDREAYFGKILRVALLVFWILAWQDFLLRAAHRFL